MRKEIFYDVLQINARASETTKHLSSLDSEITKPISSLDFESALVEGAILTKKLEASDIAQTSMVLALSGVRTRLDSYISNYISSYNKFGPRLKILKNISWYCASFCETTPELIALVVAYSRMHRLDAYARVIGAPTTMDIPTKILYINETTHKYSIRIPFRPQQLIKTYAVALGVPFSFLYQLGLELALCNNKHGIYAAWSADIVQPLLTQTLEVAKMRTYLLDQNYETTKYIIDQRKATNPHSTLPIASSAG